MSEKASPLLKLIVRLRSLGPPSLSALIAKFGDIENYQEFIMLIRDYLSEYEQEILREPGQAGQIAKFCSRFRDRYFPLIYYFDEPMMIDEDTEYSALLRGIPVIPKGWSYDEYDGLAGDGRPGVQLLAYLLESPYESYDHGERVALAEACAEEVGKELVQQVPEGGINHNDMHSLFDNSPYKAIALFGDWIYESTGNFFLDTSDEILSYGGNEPDWDKGVVEELTVHWQLAEEYENEVYTFVGWLEEASKERFAEILKFVAEKQKGGDIDGERDSH